MLVKELEKVSKVKEVKKLMKNPLKRTVTESAFSECYTTFRSQVKDVYINEPLTVFFVLDNVLHIIHKPYKKVRLTKEEEEIYNYLFNH